MEKLTKEIILETLHINRVKIRSFGVKNLILFCSFARDEQTENSDIDFLVEFEKGRGLFRDFYQLKHLLEEIFYRKIDLVEKDYLRDELKPYIFGGDLYEARV